MLMCDKFQSEKIKKNLGEDLFYERGIDGIMKSVCFISEVEKKKVFVCLFVLILSSKNAFCKFCF